MTTRETELLAANAAFEAEVLRLRGALKHIKLRSISLADAQVVALEALSTPFTPQALEALINKASEVATQKAMQACYDLGAKGIDYFNYASFIIAIRTMPGVTLEDLK